MLRTLPAAAFVGSALVATACSTSRAADPASANANETASDASAPSASGAGPTFASDVAAIVQNRCQACHHDGGIAPFRLVTYDDVVAQAAISNDKVQARAMPPWGAFDDDTCTMTHAFQNDLRMTDAEIATFAK